MNLIFIIMFSSVYNFNFKGECETRDVQLVAVRNLTARCH